MSVNIKSLVEKLFHMSSSQAMPSTSEISVSASEGEGSFTAPTDGYLVLGASRKTSSDFAVVNIWNNINTCSVSSDGYGQSRAYVPCKKGKTVRFSIIGNVDRSAFISTIGGGLNQIIQAIVGGLCHLSHSFNRFSSSLVAKQCRAVRTLILQSLRLVDGANNLLLHLTDTLKHTFSTQEQSNFQTLQQPFGQNQLLMFLRGLISLFTKAINLSCILTTKIQKELISSSSRQSAQPNLAKEVCHA